MPAFFDRAPSHLWKKLAFVCLGVLVLMACYWAYLYQSHHDQLEKTEQQAVLRSIQVANALTHQTEALLRDMGFIVRHLGEHWAGQDTAEFRRVIGIAQSTLPKKALVQIAIADAHVAAAADAPGFEIQRLATVARIALAAAERASDPGAEQIILSMPTPDDLIVGYRLRAAIAKRRGDAKAVTRASAAAKPCALS